MIKLGIITATRAEYGLLSPLIKALKNNKNFKVSVIVTGTHLSSDFGYSLDEIKQDGVEISAQIDILTGSDNPRGISECMSIALSKFAAFFEKNFFDAIVVLGDRYETMAICCAAANARIPIIHLHGGETTEGAIDEAIRHSITKMSYLHFTSTEIYRKRVIQLGESPDRVFNVGALGVENVLNLKLLTKKELEKSIDFILDKKFALVTFHPVTLANEPVEFQFLQLQEAIETFPNLIFIITKANADSGGRKINRLIDEFTAKHNNLSSFASLGLLRYLSAMKYCAMVIGNSSSGIIEAPSFNVPTVNIGDRQKGRIQADSIIDCECQKDAIILAMKHALSENFIALLENNKNPYGDGKTSVKIVSVLEEAFKKKIELNKKFFDIDFVY